MAEPDKTQRIVEVARLYYEQNLKQEEIAGKLHISRPLVSKILADAKELGIVTFEIHSPFQNEEALSKEICTKFGLKNCYIARSQEEDTGTNREILKLAVRRLEEKLGTNSNIGIDWGGKISDLIKELRFRTSEGHTGYACSLIGNSPTPNRSYHSNELLRMLCEKIAYTPKFFYSPAFFSSLTEKNTFMELESCHSIEGLWKILDFAILNIENHPSVPDFASASRFGTALTEQKAIGKFLGYYYNLRGELITGEADFTMQIPIPLLLRIKTVLAISSTNTTPEAIVGLIRTKCVTDIVMDEGTARTILKKYT